MPALRRASCRGSGEVDGRPPDSGWEERKGASEPRRGRENRQPARRLRDGISAQIALSSPPYFSFSPARILILWLLIVREQSYAKLTIWERRRRFAVYFAPFILLYDFRTRFSSTMPTKLILTTCYCIRNSQKFFDKVQKYILCTKLKLIS